MHQLLEHLQEKLQHTPAGARYMLGVVGFPGAGKSTLAQKLVAALNAVQNSSAQVVPMDGFHLPNSELDKRNLRALKGIPRTFDAQGFVQLLRQLRQTPASQVGCPAFDRSLDEPQPDAILVEPCHRLLVVEGNYLLLPEAPWDQVATLLDEVWYIDADLDTVLPRLIERHIKGGRSTSAAREKVECTDLPNARLVETTRSRACRLVKVDQEEACFSAASMF